MILKLGKMEKQYKKYKNIRPIDTINNIRNLLCSWDILLKEDSNACYNFHSCRLAISDKALAPFDIGTNGKGRAYDFSLASGYAEFMERFQNRILFDSNIIRDAQTVIKNNTKCPLTKILKEEDISLDFLYDPEEKYKSYTDILQYLSKKTIRIFSDKDDVEKEIRQLFINEMSHLELAVIPFFDVENRNIVNLPIDLCLCATGSNGMCSGNTYKEAFLQGICEIFERYSILNIFFNKLCPPSIPIEYFSDSEAEKMYYNLKAKGFKIKIIDCSLGKRIPVIGAIIINTNNNTYNIKFGADFVPCIAFERCLTEAFQSAEGFNGLDLNSIWTDECEQNYENDYENFNNIIKNSTGHWPSSIFSDKPSYKFVPFPDNYGLSDDKDTIIAKELIHELGYNIYIRDNSASKIPALYILIPGMSETYVNAKHFIYNNKLYLSDSYPKLDNINSLDENEIKKLLQHLKTIPIKDLSRIELKQFAKYDKNNDMRTIDMLQLLLMMSYRISDVKTSASLLQVLARNKSNSSLYFSIASKYVSLKSRGLSNIEIKNSLKCIYENKLIDEVIKDFEEPVYIFKNYSLSKSIDSMDKNELSGLIRIMRFYKNLNDSYINNKINQIDLESLFDFKDK